MRREADDTQRCIRFTRAVPVEPALCLSFRRMTVAGMRFAADELGDKIVLIDVGVRGRSRCSQCWRKCPRYDRLEPRRWRHLDFGTWTVQLQAQHWRVDWAQTAWPVWISSVAGDR